MAELSSSECLRMIACYQSLFEHLRAIQSNVNHITGNQTNDTHFSSNVLNSRWSELHDKINIALREVVIAKSLLPNDGIRDKFKNSGQVGLLCIEGLTH